MMKYSNLLFIGLLFFVMACGENVENDREENNAPKIELVVDAKNALGEGAIWNHKSQTFWWVDIEGQLLQVFNPQDNGTQVYNLGERIGTVVPSHDGHAIIALQSGVYKFNLATKERNLIVAPETDTDNIRLNDGKCDPAGRLWVGSMHLAQLQDKAALFRIDTDGTSHEMLDSITISNGIVWSTDKKTMYYIDTPDGNVKAYDYNNETGAIDNQRVVVEVSDTLGFPDGMAIDAEGMLWIALWNGNCVSRWDPTTGKLLSTIEMPAHNITSCAFGGPNLDTLYVTSAKLDMTAEELAKYPNAGGVFKVVPGVKGVESYFFGEK